MNSPTKKRTRWIHTVMSVLIVSLVAVLLSLGSQQISTQKADAAVPPYEILIFGDYIGSASGNGRTVMANHATALGHNVTTLSRTDPLPADLSPYDMVITYELGGFTTTEQTHLINFVESGKGLFMNGENSSLAAQNTAVANILTSLTGSSVTFNSTAVTPVSLDTGVNGNLASNPNTLSTLPFQAGGTFNGITGDNILATDNGGRIAAGAWDSNDLASGFGRVIMIGDVNWPDPGGTAVEEIFENMLQYFADAVAPANPGGVSNDIALWLKADAGTFSDKSGTNNELPGSAPSVDGGPVQSWQDQSLQRINSANDNNMAPPTLVTNEAGGLNFNPVVEFDGVDDGLNFYDDYIFSSNNGMTTFWVADIGDSPVVHNRIFDFGASGLSPSYAVVQQIGANFPGLAYSWGNGNGGSASATALNSANPLVGRTEIEFGVAGRTFINNHLNQNNTTNVPSQIDATVIAANPVPTPSPGASGPLTIGRASADVFSKFHTDGGIAEVVIYDEFLGDTDKQKIESYLALKYGITLQQTQLNFTTPSPRSYLASDGSTMWDHTAPDASTYDHDIAGIGRDDASGLGQVKSKSSNTDSIITLEADGEGTNSATAFTDMDDLEFLTWGNNGSGNGFITGGAPAGYKILQRTWLAYENLSLIHI